MKGLQVQCLYFLVLNAVFYVCTLDQDHFVHTLDNLMDNFKDLFQNNDATPHAYTKFSLRKPLMPEDDICYIIPGNPESLKEWTFNSTSKTFLVIHGWTVFGLFESWVAKLVSALYERELDANVIVVDWLYTAQNHYPVTAQNTKMVGRDIAHFIDWLEVCTMTQHRTITDVPRCSHERSIHLFIDSLVNEQEASMAYHCGSNDMFDRGMCLSCRKNHCNTVGYNIRKIRKTRSIKMYTKTRASMPFRVYHYQLKIHFSSKVDRSEMEPSLTVSLIGTKGDVEDLKLTLKEKIMTNKTHSFLLVAEKDIGHLLMVKFKWEESTSWSASSMLKMVSSWWSDDYADSEVEVHKIRIRVGETQKK
ncbi:unnamed protein product [Coregonus sp. 'balchen']|nr:unnamed protein product [Coregonus sp. 'balchen']